MQKIVFTLILGLSILFGACNSKAKQKDNSELPQKPIHTQSLHKAAFEGNSELVSTLLKENEPDSRDLDNHTPLMLASFNGHTKTVALLIENGASVNVTDSKGLTPLHFASSGPYPGTVKYLLEKGAEINARDKIENFTPLMYAASEGNMAVVKILVNHGADTSLKDIDGDTAANFARQNGHNEIADFLK